MLLGSDFFHDILKVAAILCKVLLEDEVCVAMCCYLECPFYEVPLYYI